MRVTSSTMKLLACAGVLTGFANPSAAFDPNAGAGMDQPVARYTPLPESVVPHRYYDADALSSSAASAAPTVNAAPQPVMIAPLPAVAEVPTQAPVAIVALPETRVVPVEQPAIIAAPVTYYAAQQPAAIPVAPPVYIAPYYGAPQTAAAYKANRFSLGVEGFWDRYREDIADLESNSGYGSIDGSWSHYYSPNWFSTTELRGSYGKEDYKSVSGTLDGTDQWEFEGRLLGGYDLPTGNGGHIKPYIGLDTRYYRDEGKGGVTSLGFSAYDRRIFQVMLPIGVTYDLPTASGYHFLPTLEAGPLLYGNVSSRLGNIPGYDNIENKQHSGYEVRGDFMLNNVNAQGRGWEFGPFVRYFHMEDSGTDTIPAGTFIEPKNSRLQLGAKLGYLF